MEYNHTDDNYYYNKKSPIPPVNISFKDYHCESGWKATKCSFIYLGNKKQSDSLNNKVIFKFIKREKGKEHRLDNEIQIMSELNHQYILKPEQSFLYNQYLCIITKFAPYETLYDVVRQYKTGIPEDIARTAMHQMLEALQYLHANRIWHRDIKPQNYLVYSWVPDPIYIVTADFGFSKKFEENEKGTEYIGTYDYAAPEIYFNVPYTNSIDIWSLGITLFFMLTNNNPFPKHEAFPIESRESIKEGILNMKLLQTNKNSLDAIDLITNMCKVNPSERYTAQQALEHPWFKLPQKPTAIESQTSQNILSFNNDIED